MLRVLPNRRGLVWCGACCLLPAYGELVQRSGGLVERVLLSPLRGRVGCGFKISKRVVGWERGRGGCSTARQILVTWERHTQAEMQPALGSGNILPIFRATLSGAPPLWSISCQLPT